MQKTITIGRAKCCNCGKTNCFTFYNLEIMTSDNTETVELSDQRYFYCCIKCAYKNFLNYSELPNSMKKARA